MRARLSPSRADTCSAPAPQADLDIPNGARLFLEGDENQPVGVEGTGTAIAVAVIHLSDLGRLQSTRRGIIE